MIQHSVTTMTVVLEYDDMLMTEHEAQEIALQQFPERLGSSVRVGVHYVERTHGGVDADGVPTQPKAEAPKQARRAR
jgi:hypothetical protein